MRNFSFKNAIGSGLFCLYALDEIKTHKSYTFDIYGLICSRFQELVG